MPCKAKGLCNKAKGPETSVLSVSYEQEINLTLQKSITSHHPRIHPLTRFGSSVFKKSLLLSSSISDVYISTHFNSRQFLGLDNRFRNPSSNQCYVLRFDLQKSHLKVIILLAKLSHVLKTHMSPCQNLHKKSRIHKQANSN